MKNLHDIPARAVWGEQFVVANAAWLARYPEIDGYFLEPYQRAWSSRPWRDIDGRPIPEGGLLPVHARLQRLAGELHRALGPYTSGIALSVTREEMYELRRWMMMHPYSIRQTASDSFEGLPLVVR